MKFTLNYEGDLRASGGGGGSKRLRDKWEIRNQIHPQLVELWNTHEVLKRLPHDARIPTGQGFYKTVVHHSEDDGPVGELENGYRDLLEPKELEGRKFFPLVRQSMSMVCDLDILFLRKEEPGGLITQGGDIDNRIKTLFDGLRMPTKANEITEDCVFDPTHCLLENDTLITGLTVKTDRLLDSRKDSPHAVRLVIGVTINVIHVRPYNLSLIEH